jgi:predicted P-loop ATPase
LWGEARAHYERGEAWHVDTPELRTLCEQEQREREPTDPWVDVVEAWLRLPLQISYWTGGITTAEMLTGALSLWAADIGRAEETRAGHVLRELKWTARQRRESGGRVRRYFPDPTQQEQSAPENGRDKETALEQPPVQMSLPSQPNAHTHENRGEDTSYAPSVLRRDGRDVVAGEDIERGAIESEGGGE